MSPTDAPALAWAIFAHLVAGFLLPTDRMRRALPTADEAAAAERALLPHALGVALCYAPFALVFGIRGLAFAAVLTVLHPLVDVVRIRTDRRIAATGAPWTPSMAVALLLEQLVHVALIVGAWWVLLAGSDPMGPFEALASGFAARDPALVHRASLGTAVVGSLVIANTLLASRFVGLAIPPDVHLEGEEVPAVHAVADEPFARSLGAGVGILERTLVVVFILARADLAAVFILATKELSRRTRIEQDPRFAERYLVGTFASFGFAVVTAYAARFALELA